MKKTAFQTLKNWRPYKGEISEEEAKEIAPDLY